MAGGMGEGHEWLASQPPFGAVSNPASPWPFWHHSRGAWGAWLALCLTRSPSCYSNTPPHATAALGPSSAFAHTGTRARGPWGLAQVRAWGEAARARLCASGSPVGVVAHG